MVQFEEEQQNKRPLEDEEIEGSNKRVRTGEESVEVCLLVKSNDMGQVIGKGGETIKSIRAESGASMYTSKFMKNISERTVKISGAIEQVCTAIRMIIDIVAKDHPSVTLLAEYTNLGAIIGRQGVNIKQLREESGAKIYITKECKGNSSQKEIQISGEYESVTQAVEAIVCKLAEGKNPTRIPYVPGDIGGFVLNPTAGVAGVPLNQLLLGGGGGAIPMTQGMGFMDKGAPSVCRIETTMYVPKEVIGQIIGRGGENIKTVRMQSTAHVFVDAGEDDDESPERKITIKGKRQAIDLACRMIENLVAQRQ